MRFVKKVLAKYNVTGGFFSWLCPHCGFAILNPYGKQDHSWNEAVLVTKTGAIEGSYDGYGRLKTDEGAVSIPKTGAKLYHIVCYKAAGKPSFEKAKISKSDPNQGMGSEDADVSESPLANMGEKGKKLREKMKKDREDYERNRRETFERNEKAAKERSAKGDPVKFEVFEGYDELEGARIGDKIGEFSLSKEDAKKYAEGETRPEALLKKHGFLKKGRLSGSGDGDSLSLYLGVTGEDYDGILLTVAEKDVDLFNQYESEAAS